MATAAIQKPIAANEGESPETISPLSKELVIGLVGFAGAGTSTAAKRLQMLLHDNVYKVHRIKLSGLISAEYPPNSIPTVIEGPGEGKQRLQRAGALQDLGDELRAKFGDFAVASLAIKKIIELRDGAARGETKLAFIVETIKHRDEVDLLGRVYDISFRLIAVHCERPIREKRLIGPTTSSAKYAGAPQSDVIAFIERDEKDSINPSGQQVRDAFYLADYFIDNNQSGQDGAHLNGDLNRFSSLLLGAGLVRPTMEERAMYHAHASALQSSCLSRQVGAVLVSKDAQVVSTGSNDVPKSGGGIYDEDSNPDN